MLTTGTIDWTRWADRLRPATDHAALGDELPRLRRSPAPVRWVGRLAARALYAASSVLTRRQKAYNLAMLDAVAALSERVRELDERPDPLEPVAALAERVRAVEGRPATPDAVAALADRVRLLEAGPAPAPFEAPAEIPPAGPRSFNAIYNKSSWMQYCERVLLYSMVYGARPQRVLEIGTFLGGSALIIAAALDDIGAGSMVCVDPNPKVCQENLDRIKHRATIVAAPSPGALLEAERIAGRKFDFALIDGDHSYEGVIRDVEGTLPVLAPNTYVLFHDAHYEPVRQGINDMLAKYPDDLQDCGMMSAFALPDADNPGVMWGGIRVLRFRPAAG